MNLLLLLSALLSALTGGTSAMRTPAAAHAVASAAAMVEARAIPARVASRPPQALPSLIVVATDVVAAAPAVGSTEALYASRRRE
ncbi:hypothetical protein SFC76_02315 [Sphingomonas sp. CD22]|uniref:hypothetical protein n=1 Tax=Sphingomonas sp. CD22 TaxID=3100214 RepID=UPI002ADF0079|nr:hypothetical protein [Sphingomonas sp. CD22]MEA1083080.1 hypothetical protein [Sphingomonas sp. CD22]